MTTATTHPFPTELAYDAAQHTWVRYDPLEGAATVGIDTLGQASMGDLVFLVLPALGAAVRRGQSAGSLEAAKMTGDVVCPLSGEVLAVNEAALRDPSLINRDPYGAGWLLKVRPTSWDAELPALVSGDAVAAWAEGEIARYRTQGWI